MTTSVEPEIITVSDEAAQIEPMSMSRESNLAQTTNSLVPVGQVWGGWFNVLPVAQDSVVVQLANGSFLVIYSQSDGLGRAPIFGQIFNADGTVGGSRFDIYNLGGIPVNATNLQAVVLTNGRVALAWNSGNALYALTLDPYAQTTSARITISTKADVAHVLTPNGNDGFTVVYKDIGDGEYHWNNYATSFPTGPISTGVSQIPFNSRDFDYTFVGGNDVNRNMYADLYDLTFNGTFLRSIVRIYAQVSPTETTHYDFEFSGMVN
jgi:hypothetical protein